jgi:hypothetical protein
MTLPQDVAHYPNVIAEALSQLRLAGVNGPYSVLLGVDAYTALSEASDHRYPVIQHIQRLVNEKIVWAPAIDGAFVLTKRGGDFELHLGQDISSRLPEPCRQGGQPLPAGDPDILDRGSFGRYSGGAAKKSHRVVVKNFNWHMSGPHFRDYDPLLDEHSTQIFATHQDKVNADLLAFLKS